MGMEVKVSAKHIVLQFDSSDVTPADAQKAVETLKDQENWLPLTILDFSSALSIDVGALRALTRVLGTAALNESRVVLIAKTRVRQTVEQNGLERLLPCYGSIAEVTGIDGGDSKKKVLEFLNTTLEAVAKTLEVTIGLKVAPGKPHMSDVEQMPQVDIGAVVGLIGTGFSGTLIIAFPLPTYLKVMSKMLGTTYTELSPDIVDGAAEILNMVLGQAKVSLNEKGFGIKQAIPTVVQGKDIRIHSSSNQPSVIVPFTSEIGEFYAELATSKGQVSAS